MLYPTELRGRISLVSELATYRARAAMSTSERQGRALTRSAAAPSALLDEPIKAIDPRCVPLQGHALNDLDAAHEAREQQDAGERNDRRKSGGGEDVWGGLGRRPSSRQANTPRNG